ncbi:MAG: NUDIX hydrolase [Anaerolineaceae bacterium]|nr:NUDIX hydrolase [Anaerolineaceae bacterium]
MSTPEPNWLVWGRKLQSIAQNGLAYCKNPYDIERYQAMNDLAVEILAQQTGVNSNVLANLFENETGYATPKIDVRGAMFKNQSILLVRELADDGRWTLPGGWADVTDTPSEAVIREIREESGYEAKAVKLIAVYDRKKQGHPAFYFSTYKIFFLCEITGGAPTESHETGGVGFFPEDQLPELSLGRVTPVQIHTLFKHYRHPELPTEFD